MSSRRDVALWTSVCLGPLVALCDLEASYALVTPAKAAGSKAVLFGVAIASALVVAFGAFVGARSYKRASTSAARFVACSGVVLSLFALVLVVAMAIPTIVLEPGD